MKGAGITTTHDVTLVGTLEITKVDEDGDAEGRIRFSKITGTIKTVAAQVKISLTGGRSSSSAGSTLRSLRRIPEETPVTSG